MTTTCPTCGSAVTPILYGYPSPELFETEGRGEVILGGCVVDPSMPTWRCQRCGRCGGCWGVEEDPLPAEIAQANARSDVPASAPRTWAEIGVRREEVEYRGLFKNDQPLTARPPWFVRSYVTEDSGWEPIDDDPDGRFSIGTALLREADSDGYALQVGDAVLYLGEVEGYDEPVLWAPALVVRLAGARGRRTAWTLSDRQIITDRGDDHVPLRTLDPAVQALVEELVMSGRGTTPDELATLLRLFRIG